jgi:hypothetical protein
MRQIRWISTLVLDDHVGNHHVFKFNQAVDEEKLLFDEDFESLIYYIERIGVMDVGGGPNELEYTTDTETKEDFNKIVQALQEFFEEKGILDA